MWWRNKYDLGGRSPYNHNTNKLNQLNKILYIDIPSQDECV